MIRLILLLLLVCPYSQASEEEALSKAWEACRSSKDIEVCYTANEKIKNVSRKLNEKLEEFGIKNITLITTAAAHAIVEKKIKIDGGEQLIMNSSSSFVEIRQEDVHVKIEWSF